MVEQKQDLGGIYALLTVVAVFSLVAMIGSLSSHNGGVSDQIQSLSSQVSSLNFPTASDIASKVNVPAAPEVNVPVFKSDEKVNEVWLKVYAPEISTLKSNAKNDGLAEVQKDNYDVLKDFLKANIDDFNKLKSVSVDNSSVEVSELGIADGSDKVAEVSYKLKVKYTLKTGTVGTVYKDFVEAEEVVTYNEGDFSDSQVDLTYSM